MVIAGLAKLAEEVKKYAAPMYAPTAAGVARLRPDRASAKITRMRPSVAMTSDRKWAELARLCNGDGHRRQGDCPGTRQPAAATAQPRPRSRSPAATSPGTCAQPALVSEPLDGASAAGLAQVFKALGDPVRLRLVSLIGARDGGEVCVCDLTSAFDLSQPTISHHLKVLREAGLIDSERRGCRQGCQDADGDR